MIGIDPRSSACAPPHSAHASNIRGRGKWKECSVECEISVRERAKCGVKQNEVMSGAACKLFGEVCK